jgi:hypothetical protein
MRTLDPAWGESFACGVWGGGDVLEVTVFDWDAVGDNDFLGRVRVPLRALFPAAFSPAPASAAPATRPASVRQWWPLAGLDGTDRLGPGGARVSGDVLLDLSFHPDPEFARGMRVELLLTHVQPAVRARDADELQDRLADAAAAEVGGGGMGGESVARNADGADGAARRARVPRRNRGERGRERAAQHRRRARHPGTLVPTRRHESVGLDGARSCRPSGLRVGGGRGRRAGCLASEKAAGCVRDGRAYGVAFCGAMQ